MRRILLITLLILNSQAAFAHEYWLEPGSFFLERGEKTPIHLFVGDGLIKEREERPFHTVKTEMFQLFGVSEVWNLKPKAVEAALPVYDFSAEKEGNYLLAMERNWSYIKLDAEKFEDYLREDGIDYIIPERAKLGESKKEGRERYSRFLKSLLMVGDKADQTFKKKIGQKLEIVPLENPYLKRVGDKITLQVLFNGKPLANRTVFADNRESQTQRAVTTKDGKFSVKLEKSGLWLTRLVIMQRCKSNCGEADWESFWSSFSFGIR